MSRHVYIVDYCHIDDEPKRRVFGTAARALNEFFSRMNAVKAPLCDDDDLKICSALVRLRFARDGKVFVSTPHDGGATWVLITKELIE